MNRNSSRLVLWWVLLLIGALLVLLIAWGTHVVRVAPVTLLTIGAVVIALSWLIVLVSMPWNLYFAARRAVQEMAVSQERGIAVRSANDAEARLISRRMLWLALGGHLGTALAAAVIAYYSQNKTGYYIAGIFLLSTAFRPAAAYLSHIRERIGVLTRESTHPREDVVTLRGELDGIKQSLRELRTEMRKAGNDLHHTEATLTDVIAHDRNLLVTDLNRLKDTQEADRALARSRTDDLGRQLDHMVRRIEATLDGISDHGELMAGLRALVRIVRSDPV
jgi:Na+/melibiose symporter-like transporter